MPLRRARVHRSSAEWTVRLALAAVAAALGYQGVTFSIAQDAIKSDKALAYRLAPYDGRVTAAYATALAGVDATPADRIRSDVLAKLALRQDPTAVESIATLGVNADVRGDRAAARRYFNYAQYLSRRNIRTQLFMIEDAVQRGDIPAALHQYDITLRVFPELSDMLYPVLAAASDDPTIRGELVKTLAGKPVWADSFIGFAAMNGPAPEAIAALFLALGRAGVAIPEVARAGVVNGLVAAGRTDAAWSYYAAIRPGADRRRSRNPHFSTNPETPSKFDWTPVDDGSGLATGIQGGIFDFSAPASVGGAMLQQLQLLPPGVYRLAGHSIGIDQPQDGRPYWVLACQDGREVGRVEMPNSAVANGAFSGIFSVPAGCPVQTLTLMARPSNVISGLSGQLDRVELTPVDR